MLNLDGSYEEYREALYNEKQEKVQGEVQHKINVALIEDIEPEDEEGSIKNIM